MLQAFENAILHTVVQLLRS